MAGWFDRHGCCAAIIRPDHYVFGVARDAATLIGMLRELRDCLLKSRPQSLSITTRG
jgi:3-(3-hydroxy-phenyl)propionate hydroxylase